MSRTRTILAAAVAFVALTGTAHATDWYLLDFRTGVCENAAQMARREHVPMFASPAALETYTRSVGVFKDKHIYREDDGQIRAVTVTNNEDNTNLFLPTLADCQAVAATMVSQGTLSKPDELK